MANVLPRAPRIVQYRSGTPPMAAMSLLTRGMLIPYSQQYGRLMANVSPRALLTRRCGYGRRRSFDGSYVFTYKGHADIVFSARWLPDRKRISSGSADKTVQVRHASFFSPNCTNRHVPAGHHHQ